MALTWMIVDGWKYNRFWPRLTIHSIDANGPSQPLRDIRNPRSIAFKVNSKGRKLSDRSAESKMQLLGRGQSRRSGQPDTFQRERTPRRCAADSHARQTGWLPCTFSVPWEQSSYALKPPLQNQSLWDAASYNAPSQELRLTSTQLRLLSSKSALTSSAPAAS